jgi:hypothetical protein
LTALNFLDPEQAEAWLEAAASQVGADAPLEREWFVAMRGEVARGREAIRPSVPQPTTPAFKGLEQPDALMSYTRFDDEQDGASLTTFCKKLSGEIQSQTGQPFSIFQDIVDIQLGEQPKQRIDEALKTVKFLIPILTPSFFNNAACRYQLEQFLQREAELGRNDLILPVYYIEVPALEDPAKRADDPLVQAIAARNYIDWRDLRFERFDLPSRELAAMARQIATALEERVTPSPSARSTSTTSDPVASSIQTEDQQRRLDTAMPAETTVGEPTEVWAQICTSKSRGFLGELPHNTAFDGEIIREDVKKGKFSIDFPKDAQSGALDATTVRLKVRANPKDFQIESPVQQVRVPPSDDSGKVIFLVTPLNPRRRSRVYIDAIKIDEDNQEMVLGTVALSTRIYPV